MMCRPVRVASTCVLLAACGGGERAPADATSPSGGNAGDSAKLTRFPARAALYVPYGNFVPLGVTWRTRELATTLRRNAEHGRDGFYAGPTADLIVGEMRRSNGVSMTTTLNEGYGSVVTVTGASGGAHIIAGVAQVISNVLDFGMPLGEAMAAPSFQAQAFPDSIWVEADGLPESTLRALSAMGHHPAIMKRGDGLAWVQSIARAGGRCQGVSEPRGHGGATGY